MLVTGSASDRKVGPLLKEMKNSAKHPKGRRCRVCNILVPSLRIIKEHMKLCHPDDCFPCDLCSYVGFNSPALCHHKKQYHQVLPKEQLKLACRESTRTGTSLNPCTAEFKRAASLRQHLADVHGITEASHEVTKEFGSVDDFKRWKEVFEDDTCARYNVRGGKLKEGEKTIIYTCSRSGTYVSKVKGVRKRQLKSQGSSKMGSTCTAVMCARTSEEGKVSVTVHPFHYGHATDKTDLPYIRLPKTVRDFAQEKLLKGEPASRVINDIRKSLEETGDPATRRGFWIGKRDLRNMCNSLKIRPQTETSTQKERVEMSSEELDNEEIHPPKEVDDLWQERKKLWRGPSARLSEIRQRHAAAAELVAARAAAAHRLSEAARPTWLVGPFAETDHQYIRIEQHHRLCPFGCQLRCEDCGVCAHQFTCQCQDWVSHKLPCRHMHYLCMVVEDLLGPPAPPDLAQCDAPGAAELDDTPGAAEMDDLPCVSPARELPPVTSSASRPEEGAARRQQVVTKMQKALSAIERLPDTLSEESYQRILAQLAVLERLVALEVRPQTPVQELLPSTEDGHETSNAKSDPHPTPTSKRRQRTGQSRGRGRAKSATAQRVAVNLVASDVDMENLLVVQQDHCY